MSLVLPKSIFFHAGRTGGHWVSHVLWKAGLVQERIYPLHTTPGMYRKRSDAADRAFSFTFVRHPVAWLASVWQHEMEYGWSEGSELSAKAADETFSGFLEKCLAAWPEAPCSTHLAPFYEQCDFVGRTESLSADLKNALQMAGEDFNPDVLSTPAINSSADKALRVACIAPKSLVEAVLAADRVYAEKFGYVDIPEKYIGEGSASPIWPTFVNRKPDMASDVNALNLKYDYRFQDGAVGPRRVSWRKEQRDMLMALSESEADFSTACVIDSHDPYFAIFLAQQKAGTIDFVCASEELAASQIIDGVGSVIDVVSYKKYSSDIAFRSKYGSVVVMSFVNTDGDVSYDILNASIALKNEGTIFLAVPLVFGVRFASKYIVEAGARGAGSFFYSEAYVENYLKKFNFENIVQISSYKQSMAGEHLRNLDEMVTRLNLDVEHHFGWAIFKADKKRDSQMDEILAVRENWVHHTPNDVEDLSWGKLSRSVQRTLVYLKETALKNDDIIRDLQGRLADREIELADARKDAHGANIELGSLHSRLQSSLIEAQKVNGLNEALQAREHDLSEARKEALGANIELGSLHARLQSALIDAQKVSELNEALRAREHDLSEARKEAHGAGIEVGSLHSRLQIALVEAQKVGGLNEALQAREHDLAETRKELVGLRINQDSQSARLQQLHDEVELLRKEKAELVEKLFAAQD